MEAGFGQHPDAEIYLSQPGLGTILGARVLAEFGDDPDRYADARGPQELLRHGPDHQGLRHQTGRAGPLRPQPAPGRRPLPAGLRRPAAPHPAPARYYDRHRARGATHHQALRALANRLVGILHGCLRHHTRYDENHRLAAQPDSRQRRRLTPYDRGMSSQKASPGQRRRPRWQAVVVTDSGPAVPGTGERVLERLWPSWSVWLFVVVVAIGFGLVVAPFGPAVLAVVPIVVLVVLGALLLAWTRRWGWTGRTSWPVPPGSRALPRRPGGSRRRRHATGPRARVRRPGLPVPTRMDRAGAPGAGHRPGRPGPLLAGLFAASPARGRRDPPGQALRTSRRALLADRLTVLLRASWLVVHQEAAHAGELVRLLGQHADGQLLVREVGAGQLQALRLASNSSTSTAPSNAQPERKERNRRSYEYSPSLREQLIDQEMRLQGNEIDGALAMLRSAAEKSEILARALSRAEGD